MSGWGGRVKTTMKHESGSRRKRGGCSHLGREHEPNDDHENPRDFFPVQDHLDDFLEGRNLGVGVALLQIGPQLGVVGGLEITGNVDQGVGRHLGEGRHFQRLKIKRSGNNT